jgi:hypothetical protein
MRFTESGIDRGGGCAVDGGDGKAVLGSIGENLADLVTGDDAGGNDIENAHGCKRVAGEGRGGEEESVEGEKKKKKEERRKRKNEGRERKKNRGNRRGRKVPPDTSGRKFIFSRSLFFFRSHCWPDPRVSNTISQPKKLSTWGRAGGKDFFPLLSNPCGCPWFLLNNPNDAGKLIRVPGLQQPARDFAPQLRFSPSCHLLSHFPQFSLPLTLSDT